eukprot:jgi/Chlat1/7730/Chrsp66S07196
MGSWVGSSGFTWAPTTAAKPALVVYMAGFVGRELASQVVRYTARTTGMYGAYLALYSGSHCSLEQWRAQKDGWNAAIAGGLCGALLALSSRQPLQMLQFSATTAVMSFVVDKYFVRHSASTRKLWQ